jgi:hypothetical protein
MSNTNNTEITKPLISNKQNDNKLVIKLESEFDRFYKKNKNNIDYIFSVKRNIQTLQNLIDDVTLYINKNGIVPELIIRDSAFNAYLVLIVIGKSDGFMVSSLYSPTTYKFYYSEKDSKCIIL